MRIKTKKYEQNNLSLLILLSIQLQWGKIKSTKEKKKPEENEPPCGKTKSADLALND